MKIGTSTLIKEIDGYCINKLGIPSMVLMENAALRVIKNIDLEKYDYITIVSGRGNNGGDALAVARHLYCKGKQVDVFLLGLGKISEDCEKNYNILKNMGIQIRNVSNVDDMEELRDSIGRSDMVIEGIFGVGLSREVEGIYELAITIINENSRYILSIDVPSGLNSDTGKVMGNCIQANKTISFQLYKKGFINYGTDKYTGKVIVEDIGIPGFVVDKFHEEEFFIDMRMVTEKIKVRDKYSHKGNYGRATIVAGSKGFTGAPILSTQAAVRSGAGLVTLCCYKEIENVLSNRVLEAMTLNMDEEERFQDILKKSDAIAIGPGMGNNYKTLNILRKIIKESNCPLIIDADGLNVLSGNLELLKDIENKVILTPHLGEMSRLTGLTINEIKENRLQIAKEFAYKYRIILLLKGYHTIITDGQTTVINPTGNSSMASGGMGDCLTGIITSFVAQGYNLMEATYLSAFIHGYCGEELSNNMYCVNASHLIEELPRCIKKIMDKYAQ